MFSILYHQPNSWGVRLSDYLLLVFTMHPNSLKIINTKIMTSYFSASIESLVDKTMYRDDHGYFVSLFAHEYCTQSFLSGSESAESQTAYQHH